MRPSHLDRILGLDGLATRYQPVIELTASGVALHAYEALSRGPAGTNFASADILFAYARRMRSEDRIDRACVRAVLRDARGLCASVHVAVNVHASTLSRDPSFVDLLICEAELHGIALTRLIVEIVEHAEAWDEWAFATALHRLRSNGISIALDDIGLGLSNFRMMVDSRPDYMKIDRYFVTGARGDRYRRAVLETVAALASKVGARVIAEGVETESDLRVVTGCGIDLVQGFLFAAPMTSAEAEAFAVTNTTFPLDSMQNDTSAAS